MKNLEHEEASKQLSKILPIKRLYPLSVIKAKVCFVVSSGRNCITLQPLVETININAESL